MNGFLNNLISYSRQVALGVKELKTLSLSKLRKVFSLMGKKEKIAVAVLLLAAAVNFFFSARNFYFNHTVVVAGNGGNYTEGLLGQPAYINPLLARSETDLALTKLVFSGLYKFDLKGQLTPDLADGMPVNSEDQKQYTVNLKKGLTWQDGKTLNADDIIFTFQTLKDPNYKSPLRSSWNATTVEKLSDYSVRFTTQDISGPFVLNLTLGILPQHLWSRVDSQNFLLAGANLAAVGSGPYAIKEIKKLPSGKIQQIGLESFSGSSGGKANIDGITIKFYDTEEDVLNALHSKEISGYGYVPLGSNLYVEKTQKDFNMSTVPLLQYQVLFFNLNNKTLSDQNIRQALLLATNKQQIIDNVFKGNAVLPVSPLLFAKEGNIATSTDNSYNLDQAKQILDKAGWVVNPTTHIRSKNNKPLEFTITTNDFLLNSQAAEAVAAQWKQLNITVNLSIVPTKQLTDTVIRTRGFDVLLFPQKFSADPDPFLFWHSSQIKDPGVNLTGFSDPLADRLITEARTTTDQKIREQKYQQFNQLIKDKVPVIFLDQTEYIYVVSKDINNMHLGTLYENSQRFNDITGWYINTKRVWK